MFRLFETEADELRRWQRYCVWQQARDAAAAQQMFTSAGARAAAEHAWIEIGRPLTVLSLNAPVSAQLANPTRPGHTLLLPTVNLPIGSEILSVTCTAADVDRGWLPVNLTLGTLNLVHPQGSGPVNLSAFDPRTPHQDKVTPYILSKSKIDVQVSGALQNGAYEYGLPRTFVEETHANFLHFGSIAWAAYLRASKLKGVAPARTGGNPVPSPFASWAPCAGRGVEAVFHGFAINMFQEEQVCAIQTRIEPSDRMVGCAELVTLMRQHLWSMSPRGAAYWAVPCEREPLQPQPMGVPVVKRGKVSLVAEAAATFFKSVANAAA